MINAYSFYQNVIVDKVNKVENGYIDFEKFNRVSNLKCLGYFRTLISRLQDPQAKANDRQAIKDELSPFLEVSVLPCENGMVSEPADFQFFDALMVRYDNADMAIRLSNLYALLCEADNDPTIDVADISSQIAAAVNSDNFIEVELIDHAQLGKRLHSYIPGKRPHAGKPVAVQENKGFEFFPKDISSVRLSYYRAPKAGFLNMLVDNTGMLMYDSLTSVDFEFRQSSFDNLAILIAQEASVFLRERDLFQMTEQQLQDSAK